MLPVPATYVIGRDGKIKFAYFNPDYRHRVSVWQVAQAARQGPALARYHGLGRLCAAPAGFISVARNLGCCGHCEAV